MVVISRRPDGAEHILKFIVNTILFALYMNHSNNESTTTIFFIYFCEQWQIHRT